MESMKIAICDDERETQDYLVSVIKKYQIQRSLHFCIEPFDSPSDLLDEMKKNGAYDIVFLDIRFPTENISGIDVGRVIREDWRDGETYIVYISSQTQYALDLFANNPFDFLIKPILDDKVYHILDRIVRKMDKDNSYFSYVGKKTSIRMKLRDILYFSSEGRKVVLTCTDGTREVFYAKMDAVEAQLEERRQFLRIHKSFLVNAAYIKKYAQNYVTLTNGEQLSVSQSHRQTVLDQLVEMSKNDR